MEASILGFNDQAKLKTYVQSLDSAYLCSELSKICLKDNGAVVLQKILNSLSNTTSCQEKRMKILTTILDDIQKGLISHRLGEKLISIFAAEASTFTTQQLVKLTDYCLKMIQSNNRDESYNCWKDFLPTLMNIIIEKETIEHDGSDMTGSEYKSEVVTTICVNAWPDSIITNIAAMFVEMPLSNEEHLKVVNKLCRRLPNLITDEIPPLTHQILQLTKTQHCICLFISLQEYFDKNLYAGITPEMTLSQTANNGPANLKEIQNIEGTVLFHIFTAASCIGSQSIKEFLKILRESLHAPEFILKPFYITLLLTISCLSYNFEEEVTNLIRSAISRTFLEEDKIAESKWIETMVPTPCKVELMLEKIIQNCYKERDKVLKGLVGLSFSLLGMVKTRGKEAHCEQMWGLGSRILIKLVRKYNDVTPTVLQSLTNQISQVHESTQYTDCLTQIVRKAPLNLLDCSSALIQLIDHICARLPGDIGKRVVAAILPLTRMSHSLRDNLIIALRKSLFPHDKTSREMAVSGFLELLKDLKISDMKSLSQSMSQTYCGLSQLYSESRIGGGAASHSNEGMCLEILAILKEVFKHQSDVKIKLYIGVYDSVCSNIELGCHVLDNLQDHLEKFYLPGDDVLPPLDFQKVVGLQGITVVVQEPIPYLILAISLVCAKINDESAKSERLKGILNSLCQRMIESDVPNFDLEHEEGLSLLDSDPESQMKQEKLRQILGVYEALMAYTLCAWRHEPTDKGRMLYSLFRSYSRLSDFAKGLGKFERKKTEEKGKARKKGEPKEKDKEKNKKDKTKTSAFKFPQTIFNFKCCSRLLSLLNETSVKWAPEESTLPVKGKRELHRYAMQVALTLIKQAQLSPSSTLSRTGSTLRYLCKLARTIYTRCLKRLAEIKEFDLVTALLSLECFSEILSLVLSHFKTKFSSFLADITDKSSEAGISNQLKSMIDTLLGQLSDVLKDDEEDEEETKEDEQRTKKVSCHLISITLMLVGQLPRGSTDVPQVLEMVKKLCKERKVESPFVAKGMLALFLSIYLRCKTPGSTLMDLSLCLCDSIELIDDEMTIEEHVQYGIINEKTATMCFVALCDSARTILNETDWTISRFKAELSTINLASEEPFETKRENLQGKERDLCRHISIAIKMLSTMCTIAVPPGVYSDALLKELMNVYSKLSTMTKYFTVKVVKYHQTIQSTRFEKTVKLVDHDLTKNMYCFTEHVISDGAGSNEEQISRQSKKDPTILKNKSIKETKIIPRVIYEKEQFQKCILLLSNKAKIDLVSQTKHTMARDYKLSTKQVKEILEKENIQGEEESMETDTTEDTGTDTSSQVPLSKRLRTE